MRWERTGGDMALFSIDESSGLPVWVQLRNRFVYLIKTGQLKPGDQLPSVRSLAADVAVNYNTVSKVYVDLERDGYVTTVRGKGVFVRRRDEPEGDEVRTVADAVLRDAIRKCLTLGMSLDEVGELAGHVIQSIQAASDEKQAERNRCL